MDNFTIDKGSRFLASTLHEVRTPIQTIICTTELLQDTTLDNEQTEYVHQIEFSANALLQLANDVLDFTKIRSENFKLENIPFDVVELTERVVDLIAIEAFNKKLEVITDIDYNIPRQIMGDPTRLQQIILNLIKNAVKFTSKGFIMVRLRMEKRHLLFEIIDTGIGVDIQKQKLVFNDFYQVDASTTRKFGGSGLGLAISKNLVEVMKGKIGIYSDGQMGSNFWFTIPMEKSVFESEEPLIEVPEKTRILIVDNSQLSLKTLKSKLTAMGIKDVVTSSSGHDALAKMSSAIKEKRPFTIAFITLKMPALSGWHIAAEINHNPELKNIKLYLMVPEGQMGKDAKMKMLNWYNGYIYKPIKRDSLITLLTDAFSQKAAAGTEQNTAEEKKKKLAEEENLVAAGKKILVAEDHPVNRKIIITFLEKFGAQVYSANDGEEAVQQIKNHPEIDLIFMDILMPVKSGIDATIEIRQMDFKGIIVACTANNDPEDFKTYQTLGINDILLKPFKRGGIRQVLEKWNTVLSFPEAKEVISLADINIKTADLWDIKDFTDTTNNDPELAVSLIEDYVEQTEAVLAALKTEIERGSDFAKLELYTHTLKGSSSAISALKLTETAKRMNINAKQKNLVELEALRTEFCLDFLELKQTIKTWKSTL